MKIEINQIESSKEEENEKLELKKKTVYLLPNADESMVKLKVCNNLFADFFSRKSCHKSKAFCRCICYFEFDVTKTCGRAYWSDWTEKGRFHWQNEVAWWYLRTFKKHDVNPGTCANLDKTGLKKVHLSLSLWSPVTGKLFRFCMNYAVFRPTSGLSALLAQCISSTNASV